MIQTFTFRLSPIIGYLILFFIFVQFQLAQRELNKELEKLGQERGDLLMEVGKLEQESEVSNRSQRSVTQHKRSVTGVSSRGQRSVAGVRGQ